MDQRQGLIKQQPPAARTREEAISDITRLAAQHDIKVTIWTPYSDIQNSLSAARASLTEARVALQKTGDQFLTILLGNQIDDIRNVQAHIDTLTHPDNPMEMTETDQSID